MSRPSFFQCAIGAFIALQLVMPALAQDEAPTIYPGLAAGLIDQGVLVIDVRSDEEVSETGVLANAEHIPHTEIDAIIDSIGERPARAVVLYCGSGRRASRVIDALRQQGYGGGVNAGGYADLQAALAAE